VVEVECRRLCATEVSDIAKSPSDLDGSYTNILLQALVSICIDSKDASRLRVLLDRNCPIYIGQVPTEYCFAENWPQGLRVLFDCYSSSGSQHAKSGIVACLKRAFHSLYEQYPSEGDFVKAAQKWYDANLGKVVLNENYPYLPSQAPSLSPQRKDLFLMGSGK
jgi:hypothetical protein